MPPETDLHQRLELLRIQGARHRLELAMSLESLVNETGGIRRGAGVVLTLLGMVAGIGRASVLRAVARVVLPVLLSVFAGTRAGRVVNHLRSKLEIGTLGVIVYRYIRGVLRKPRAARAAK